MSDTISISIKELETLLESAKKVKDLKKEDATNIILIQVLKKCYKRLSLQLSDGINNYISIPLNHISLIAFFESRDDLLRISYVIKE